MMMPRNGKKRHLEFFYYCQIGRIEIEKPKTIFICDPDTYHNAKIESKDWDVSNSIAFDDHQIDDHFELLTFEGPPVKRRFLTRICYRSNCYQL